MTSKPIAPIEVGSFTASSSDRTEFIGSSSGVFFVNTVFRAFAQSARTSDIPSTDADNDAQSPRHDPGSVDSRLVDPGTPLTAEDESREMRIHIEVDNAGPARFYGVKGHRLGIAPDQETARELLMLYLRNWHPLFPFLHGPTLLESISDLYETSEHHKVSNDSLRTRLCQAVICQCVFNIAELERSGQTLAPESRIESSSKLLSILGYVANNHDIPSIQALLAAQLYLVATMALRAASTVGGTLARTMYHAGLHRCPYRYPQVLPPECDLRKRIFWSAYVLDRYLSQALGHPLGFQDSDLDVCIPGTEELHRPVKSSQQMPSTNPTPGNGVLAHLPRTHPVLRSTSEDESNSNPSDEPARDNNRKQGSRATGSTEDTNSSSEILANYVLYCRLIGQALELFHKSLQYRKLQTESMVELQAEVHSWWNSLPSNLQDEYTGGKMELSSAFTFFFIILYNQLLLVINRPFLSLAPKSLEFRSSLQTCVTASRQIITTLRHQSERKLSVSWPGMLSVSWMAGLVLSFACTLRLYPFKKAQREIEECIDQIGGMDRKGNNARHCAEALRRMLETLKRQYNDQLLGNSRSKLVNQLQKRLSTPSNANPSTVGEDAHLERAAPPEKRRKTNPQEQNVGAPSNDLQDDPNAPLPSTQRPSQTQGFETDMGDWSIFDQDATLPTLGYTGPEFSAGTSLITNLDNADYLRFPITDDLYANNLGSFGTISWEAMANDTDFLSELSAWGVNRF
ncbi:hypothetical protein LTR93_010665 [Exophiala xenobiotica]|nr:hypothetical protein LTR93_010665 [Exophiala xenobiotica]KAK5415964.1 hypothetical protein LTR06_004016 [Exophiala xenobiotica]